MEGPEEKLEEEILNGVALRPRVNSETEKQRFEKCKTISWCENKHTPLQCHTQHTSLMTEDSTTFNISTFFTGLVCTFLCDPLPPTSRHAHMKAIS